MIWQTIAWAQAAGPGSPNQGGEVIFAYLVPMVLLFAILYFVQVRPQVKKTRDHQKMLSALKRNDEVVMTGGLLGRVVQLGDKLVTLEIAPNVTVRVERAQIAALSTYGKTSKGGKDKDEAAHSKGSA
jgi:preprotein translocase subunit YajC